MPYKTWKDLKHKSSPERIAQIDREVKELSDRMGYAALRKARALTQVEMAAKLGLSQSSIAGLESRTDLQLSTLAKYIRAMGGDLEIRAVFPDATFNLEPLPPSEQVDSAKQKKRPAKRALAKAS